jgi:hypothetical protein
MLTANDSPSTWTTTRRVGAPPARRISEYLSFTLSPLQRVGWVRLALAGGAGLRCREADLDDEATAGLRAGGQVAVVGGGDDLDDGQAEPEAAVGALIGAVRCQPLEGLEEPAASAPP